MIVNKKLCKIAITDILFFDIERCILYRYKILVSRLHGIGG